MQRFRLFILLLLGALAILLPISVSAQSGQPAAVLEDHAGGTYNGLEVTLAADRAPAPGEVVTLTVTTRPLQPAPDLRIVWELADGGELLDGPLLDTLGAVAAGQSATLTRQARFDKAGVYQVRARATYFANDATSLAASGVLFFTVRERTSAKGEPTASDLDPRTPVYTPPPARTTIDKSGLASSANNRAQVAGCFHVHGILARENQLPFAQVVPETPAPAVPRYSGVYQSQTGAAVPVHNILVEMREEDTFSDDSYGWTVTDASGGFSFDFCDDDGFLNDELELYYRVCAEVWDGPSKVARVENIDDRDLYCWDSNVIDSEGGDVDFDLANYRIGQIQAQVFNIADALYYGWKFWNNNAAASPPFDRTIFALWQPGSGQKGSFYSNARGALVIADDPSSTDEWDDSVIIHEWSHFADSQFSCNQNPGGAHSLPGSNAGTNGTRLAWGEGYPDYYQSAARTIMPGSASLNFYVDPDGPTVDLENMRGVTASDRDEGAVAALLWDFFDTANDNNDTVSPGQAAIQQVYAAPDFQGNAQCDLRRFLQVWRKLKKPTDAATAATIVQNANITLASLPAITLVAAQTGPLANADAPAAAEAAPPFDFRWWDQVSMVVDNSSSMAGPAGTPKINTVKTILNEQVSDLAPRPSGTEFNIYTFNAGSAANKPLIEGEFFAKNLTPAINGLTAGGADSGCPVNGLSALAQAADGKFDGAAWLYTDGDSGDTLNAEQMRQMLNDRRVQGSIVLLGGCGSPARKQPDVSGSEETYLTLAADGSQPSGMVPYLMTALGTGGQFITVAPDQLANAVDIVRAQLSHTAGAGRWSDYVSNTFTYRWDRLEPWEYQWFPAESLGQDAGQLSTANDLLVDLPNPFPFYGKDTSQVAVSENGFIRMNPCLNPQFCSSLTYQYLNLLYTDLHWRYISPGPSEVTAGDSAADEYGLQVHAYKANFGFEWFILSTQGIANYQAPGYPEDAAYRSYQAWLNYKTGEIRFLYGQVRNEAATAEISLVRSLLLSSSDVTVSKNDISGAGSGMGYKFTPAPPQPTKTYNVDVDPLITSVVFLQTGYSGDFAPLAVSDPDGKAIDCNDTANVRCLIAHSKPGDNMVQFVQVNTNGRGGVYKATVAVGPSGGGTFSFNALAASDLRASSPGRHTLPLESHAFLLDLGRATDDNMLQGWLQTPAGAAFGTPFTLYDDGAHGDGAAADGRFGSALFTPGAPGAAYLWVQGTTGGVAFKRSDPAPFNFQPLNVTASPLNFEGYYGDDVPVTFFATNQASVRHCYAAALTVPDGWSANLSNSDFCLNAGATLQVYATVKRALGADTKGETGDVALTVTETLEGAITGSATAQVALFRRPAAIAFDNRWVGMPLRPNGKDTAGMTLNLFDDLGQIVGISAPAGYELTALNGTVMSPTGVWENGRLPVQFTAGTTAGPATISALAEGGLQAETTILLAKPEADSLIFSATPTDLSQASSAALLATVLDVQGSPVAGQTVRFSAGDDDGDKGTIGGGEVLEVKTNAQGQALATFNKTEGGAGSVVVRAELLDKNGAVRYEESLLIRLSPLAGGIYLPVVVGGR